MAPDQTEKGKWSNSMPVKTQFYKIWQTWGWRDRCSSDHTGPPTEDDHADAVSNILP